jgi:hypothetical protein
MAHACNEHAAVIGDAQRRTRTSIAAFARALGDVAVVGQ